MCLAVTVLWATSVDAQFWKRKKDSDAAPVTEEPAAGQVTTISSTPAAPGPVPPAGETAVTSTSGERPTEKRALYRLKDQDTVDALVKLAAGRKLREQELLVVSRLVREKTLELSGFNERLQQQFGIQESGNYHYDNEKRIIYELVEKSVGPSEGVESQDPVERFEKNPVRKLKDKPTEEAFLKLVGAKKITSDEIRALQLILQEKKIELANIQDSLSQQFSMAPEKHYEYDADTRIVYEMVFADQPGETAAVAAPGP